MNLPDYNFIPAPLWLITTLHLVTLTLHFVAMNFLFGGLFVLLFGRLEGKWDNAVVKRYVQLFPTMMAATVTLGVAPLLFLQLTYYDQVYSASIVSAWLWLFVVVTAMVGYYFLYGAAFSVKNRRPAGLLAMALIAMAYVSFVYSSVFSMAERPDLYRTLYAANQSGAVVNPDIGAWGARWLHMLAGAVTVGAFFVGLLGRNDENVYRLGRNFFLWGMAVSVVLGIAYMMTMGEALVPFMHSIAIWLTLIALVLSLGSLHFYFRRRFAAAGAMLFISLLGMVVTRHAVRLIELTGEWNPATIPVSPQWSVFGIFLVCFLLAIGLVAYMVRAYLASRMRAES